ncbi:MAG: hypothetical protein AB8G22_07165 [Saprospiraceae bacterium]
MNILPYLLFFYAFIGLLIAGGLLFNTRQNANIPLGLFILIYAIEEFDFLYQTGSLLQHFPQFYLLGYPLCLLGGPLLFFHLRPILSPAKKYAPKDILHFIPFFGYLLFTVYLFQMNGAACLVYVEINYATLFAPLNYGKVIHVIESSINTPTIFPVAVPIAHLANKSTRTFLQME